MVKINGEHVDADGSTVLQYLENHNYNPTVVAVELNGSIVPKRLYNETVLSGGDSVEVVSFVGGG